MDTRRICLSIWIMQVLVALVQGQPEISPPGLTMRSRETFTNKTMDQLITEALGGIEVAANKMLAPGENILAELDMMLTQDQFLSLYEPPSSYRSQPQIAPPANVREKRKAISDTVLRWTNNEIPYTFARGHFTEKETYLIKQAMTEWERYTCLSFRPANERDRNVLHFQNGEGCNSQLGMVGGVQLLNLEEGGCRYTGLYLHEIGHAIGLVHEHQLPNRDDYITILYQHVAPQMRIWFNKYDRNKINQFDNRVLYEYSSVMHYGITAFSYDGKSQTIRAADPTREKEIGKVFLKQLSFTDVKAVNLMYKCGEFCPKTVRCRDGGYVDQNCRCVCPDGTDSCDESQDAAPDATCVNEEQDWKCAVWAQQGECERNEPYMSVNCRKACRLCGTRSKEDEENHFTTWAWQWFGMFTSLLPPDWIIGVCQDAYPVAKCTKWKEKGDCVTNPGWMARNCRRTCEACQENKMDNSSTSCENSYSDDAECERWAVDGECKINPSWMSRHCARSCHTCNLPDTEEKDEDEEETCYDQYNSDKCRNWAQQGECAVNPTWMVPNCRKSCNKCYDDTTCKNLYDDDQQCQIWAADGECEANPSWMKVNCRMACRECGSGSGKPDPPGRDDQPRDGGTTSDPTGCPNSHNDVECEMWAKYGHCDINPLWMRKHCKRSCKSCNTGTDSGTVTNAPQARCHDEDSKCEAWAKTGFCESNPRYNLIHCKKACKNCNGCRDTHVLCPVWAKALHCEINAIYMLRECQKSCKVC